MIKTYITMDDVKIVVPGIIKHSYKDINNLTKPLELSELNIISLLTPIDETFRDGFIYILPYHLGIIPNPDIFNQFIWRYNIKEQRLESNGVYNRIFNNKLITPERVAFYFLGFNKLHTDVIFKIHQAGSSHEFVITSDTPKERILFPLNTSYIFKDPYYIEKVSQRFTQNLVPLRSGVPDISAAILRDNSIMNSKYQDRSISGSKIDYNTISSGNLNIASMKNMSVRSFKEDYNSAMLIYDEKDGNRTRFDTTDKASWTIGGIGGVTREVSIVSSTFESYRIVYNGTTNVTSAIDSYPRLYNLNETYFTDVNNIKKDVQIVIGKTMSDVVETKGLVISTHPTKSNSDLTIDKTSAILTLSRNAGQVQLNLNGYTNGTTPVSASFVTGILGGRQGNDYVDLIPCKWVDNTKAEHGYCYAINEDNYAIKVYDPESIYNWGICSLKYAISAGDSEVSHLPWAVAGLVDVYYNGECEKSSLGNFVYYSYDGTVIDNNNNKHFEPYPPLGQIKYITDNFDEYGHQLVKIRLF